MNFLDDRKIKKIAKDENIKAPNKIIRCLYTYLAISKLVMPSYISKLLGLILPSILLLVTI